MSNYQQPAILVQGAHIRGPCGIKAGADGNLYVASVLERAILVIDPDSGEIIKRLGPEVDVDGPDDLAFGPDGSIYWTDPFNGSVGRLAPDGGASSQMVARGVNPIIFSPDGRLFVALAFLGDALYELDPNLTAPPRLLAEKLGGLNSFQFGPDGMLYSPVTEKGQVVRIDVNADPLKIDVVTEGLDRPVAAKLDSQGRLYTMKTPGIVRVDTRTGATETIAVVPHWMDNFIFDAHDRLFISLFSAGTIAEAMADGSLRMLGRAGMVMPGGIALMGDSVYVGDIVLLHEFNSTTGEFLRKIEHLWPSAVAVDGGNLVLAGWTANSVAVWNPRTEEVIERHHDFKMPLNAIRFQGDLVVAELGTNSVVRANASTPGQHTTLINELGMPAGLVADQRKLWVSDRSTGRVWQLTGVDEPFEQPRLVTGGLDRPEGLALTQDGRLLVAEAGTGRLLEIDLATGALSTIAQGLGFCADYPEGMIPWGGMSSVAVGPSGAIYVTADEANVLYRIDPVE